ncbi:MAG TPA: hypothetical protein VHB77_11990 [Planctomycetaceae bacterium]|nr:hypothetical protein [Planctomycetaceae bacterium]
MNRVRNGEAQYEHSTPDTVKFSLRDVGLLLLLTCSSICSTWIIFGGLEHRVTVVETKVEILETDREHRAAAPGNRK